MMFLLIVTLTSMLLAAIMSVIAWRIAGDERRRSDARVAALSAEIHAVADAPRPMPTSARTSAPLFAAPRPSSGARPLAAFVIGALVVGAVGAVVVVLPRTRTPRIAPQAAATSSTPLPLELVALGHERDGDQLTVRGVVRNPSSGAGIDRLTAVVFIFTPDGGFLATGRAAVEAPALQPGGEATFAVTVPRAGDVGRYRVSFRTGDRLVPHLDRRHEG